MQKELANDGSVPVQVVLKIVNALEALLPEMFSVAGDLFIFKQLGMNTHHQYLFVIRPVEDANMPTLGKAHHAAPQWIVTQFLGGWLFERINLAALRVDAGHNVLDSAVLARRVHRLEDQQYGVAILRV